MSSAGHRTDKIIEEAKDTKENLLAAATTIQDYIDGRLTRAGLEEKLGVTRNASRHILGTGGQPYVQKTALSTSDMAGLLARLRTPGERLLDAVSDAGGRSPRGGAPVRPADYPEFGEELLWAEAEKALPPRGFGIVKLRFGRDGGDPMTYQEIAERCGISWQRVHQIISQSLEEFRKPRFLKAIFPDPAVQASLAPAGTCSAAKPEALLEELSGLRAERGMLREENASLRNRLSLAAGIIGAPPAEKAMPGGGKPAYTRFSEMILEGTMPKKLRKPLFLSGCEDLQELASAPAEDIAKLPRIGHDRMLEIADLIEDALGIRRDDIRELAADMKARKESCPSNRRRAKEQAGRKD